ncbi:MAG: WD40 repeat domain-containing protein, partial [Okeania sp. SIO1H6]|nr:WD40 repeat domain-containing protein [Okeania sp. SIO1H6]
NKDINQRLQFYDFLQECLKISFINVIISLREDFINYLLECNRLVSLDIINNDILSKKHIYYIGDFSIKNAKSVIQGITSQTTFTLTPELIDELVKDLAGNLNTVRPIELQIVGSQLQNENITTLVEYQENGPKQAFVGRYLEEVIKYCGPENERLAKVVLYFLTDENNTRPLKSRVELEEYTEKPERMELILTVLVQSRLVFRIPASPSENYQLVHDYLAYFVRKEMSEVAQISAELEKERELRKQTEKMLNEALRKELNSARRAAFTLGGMLLTIGAVATAATLFGINSYLSGLSAASKDNTELDRLVSAIEAGKKLKWLSFGATPGTKLQVLSELSTAIQEVKEFNRFEEHEDDVTHVSFSNDEKMIATGSKDDTVKVWWVDGSQKEKTFKEHSDDITQVDFSSDGKIVASVGKDDRAIIRWIDGSKKPIVLEHNDDVLDISFSPDNQFLATACKDKIVRIWNIKDGNLVKIFDSHTAPVTQVTFSPNGKIVASADDYDNVKLWFIDEEKEVDIDNYATTNIDFIDDETIIFSSRGNDFKVYKVNGELIKIHGESLEDYTHNVISDDRQLIFNVSKHRQNFVNGLFRYNDDFYFYLGEADKHSENISDIGLSPNNKFLVSASEDDTVRFWQLDNLWKHPFLDRKEHISSFDRLLSATITRINKSLRKVEVLQNNQDFLTKIIVPNSYTFSFSPDNQNFITNSTDYSYYPKLWNIDKGEIALQKNTGSVKNISVSSDGKRVAAISNNKFIQLWNSKGFPLQRLEHNEVKKLAFSPDSEILVSVSYNQIKLWTNKGKLIAELDGDYQQLRDIIFSLDSQVVTVINDDKVNFFSRNGQLINSFDGDNKKIEKIILSPDKQIIATKSYNQVKLWNLNGKLIKDLGGHYQKVEKVIFSPDSQIIASIGDDNFAKIWRINGNYIRKLEHIDKVRSLDFSRDSKKIITLSYNYQRQENSAIKLWKSDGTPIKPYQIYDYGINNINLHPDGNFIVSTSSNVVKLWDSDGKLITILKGHYGEINDVKFSPDGEIIATASNDRTIKLWSSKDGSQIKTLQGHKYPVKEIIFSLDGNILASIGNDNDINGEETVIFWDKKGNYLKAFQGKEVSFEDEDNTITSISEGYKCDTLIFWQLDGKNLKTPIESEFCEEFSGILGYSSDRKTIAWGKTEYPLKLWSIDGQLIRTFKGHSAWVNSTSFSPDGTKIVSGSDDKTIKIWQRDGQLIRTIQEDDEVNTVTFSPDGEHILSGSDDETLKVWSLDGKLIDIFKDHTDIVSKATFSPDGKMIASVSNNDTVILWDIEKKKRKKRIKNDNESVESISFSPKGNILAIEHDYGKVTLHLLNGIFTKKTQLYTTNSFLGEKFSPDGKAIAVQNQSGVLLLNADLDDLLNRACNWASAYLKTTENEDIKHLCD